MEWDTFWNGGESLPPLGIFLRVTILYFTILLMTRLMGPRQVGIVSAFNFIIHAGMAHVATARMVNPESSLFAALTIIVVGYSLSLLLSWLDYKFPSWVGTSPIPLVRDGQVLHQNLKKAHLTLDDLLAQLRLRKIHNVSEVAVAVMEPMGEVSALQKPESSPTTRQVLRIPSTPAGASTNSFTTARLNGSTCMRSGFVSTGWNRKLPKRASRYHECFWQHLSQPETFM